ncbi:MAG TPA: phenylalanine--tRNA ligase subunit alpha [Terriglobia bacterium]|nr:phenylalanine--tRNA ligase subunit alpha [Terriglobia bacterium]
MSFEEKLVKALEALGAKDEASVRALFVEVRDALESEKRTLLSTPAANDADRMERAKALRDRWLSRRNGLLAQVDEHWLKPASRELKPVVGLEFNQLRQLAKGLEVEELIKSVAVDSRSAVVGRDPNDPEGLGAGKGKGPTQAAEAIGFDPTLPGNRRPLGSIHPITRVQREIEEIFLTLGFWIESGPEIESVYYNFDALNIPESHPARDDWDTFYIDSQTVLRTHTSPVQIHAMEKYGAPLHIIIPGKCYRRDNPDATHYPMFHQIEGMAIDQDVTFADLKGTLDFFAKRFFGDQTRTSFHPSFFPFTEPSGEVAVSCPICDGQGCRTCKQSGWIEVMGCGMVHPEVLRRGGIDPDRYSGWAFGLGVERYAMMKYGIHDIQLFYQGDLRFLEQF